MTKRLSRKLLSVILVIAICCTTVLGCLITASAAVSGTYTFGEAKINADATQATVDLTFEIPDGKFTAGMFTLNEENYDAAEHLILTDVSASGEISATFDTEDLDDGVIANVMVDAGESENVYSSATITLTFAFSNGEADSTKNYEISVSGIEFANSVSNYYKSFTGVNCIIAAGCEHVVTVTGDPIKVDAKNGYSVYEDSVCANCKESLGYQVVPTQVPSDEIWYWDGGYEAIDTTAHAGTAYDPYIIENAQQLNYVATKVGVSASTNRYFKIADGVDAIVLQSSGAEAIMALDNADDVKAYFESITPLDWLKDYNSGIQFNGNFDGNNVAIYGLYINSTTNHVGLFPQIDGGGDGTGVSGTPSTDNNGITFKNIVIKNSYYKVSGKRIGAVVGHSYGQKYGAFVNGAVNFERITVANCYMYTDSTDGANAGILGSNFDGDLIHANNILVYGNETLTGNGVVFPVFAAAPNDRKDSDDEYIHNTVTNSVLLGVTPYNLYKFSNRQSTVNSFENVYTDAAAGTITFKTTNTAGSFYTATYATTDIKNVEPAELVGSAAAGVVTALNAANDGENIWTVDETGGYPLNVEVNTIGKNIVYAIGSATDGTQWNAADGSFMNIDGKTNVGTGTKDDPFILSTPGHFRYLAQKSTYDTTYGKYFAIDPTIDIMVFQYESVINNNGGIDAFMAMSADEIKAFFNAKADTDWVQAQHSNTTDAFYGHLDGNGAVLTGIYTANGVGALFGKVGAGATFENLTVRNSYFRGNTGTVGAIAANAYAVGGGSGTITFDKCAVYNNVLTTSIANNAVANSGVLVGDAGGDGVNTVTIKNCLVYGNKTMHTNSNYNITFGLIGRTGYYYEEDGTTKVYSTISDSVILDCVPHSFNYNWNSTGNITFSNIYTNMVGVSINNTDFTKTTTDGDTQVDYTFTNSADENGKYTALITQTKNGTTSPLNMNEPNGSIYKVNLDDIEGVAAKDVLALDFENDWVLDLSEGYPTPKTPTASVINETSSTSLNLKAYNLTYNEDGSFNFNFYYTPQLSGFAPKLIVPQADLSGYMTLSPTALSDDEANALGVKAGTLRYTIERLSAREIPDTLLATVITEHAGTAAWGKTEAVSIRDYAVSVINGNYEQADKNVAAALINYGDASKAALETGYDYVDTEPNIVYADKTTWFAADGSFMDVAGETNVGTGTKDDPFIISTPNQWRYLAQKSTYDTTYGKYFAIDPTIDIMVFQYESYMNAYGGIDAFLQLDANGVKSFFENNTGNNRAQLQSAGGYFAGHLDGNGVQIVAAYTGNSGLIATVYEDASFENFVITNCLVSSTDYAGGFIGQVLMSDAYRAKATNDTEYGYVYFNKIEMHDNYIVTTSTNPRAGVLVAYVQGGWKVEDGATSGVNNYIGISVSMKNVIVYENVVLYNTSKQGALFGALSGGHDAVTNPAIYHDSIILDCVPYATATYGQAFKPAYYSNVYTNIEMTYKPCSHGTTDETYLTDYAGKIINIGDSTKAKGSNAVVNMPDLDWTNTWLYGYPGEYPSLAQGDVSTQTAGEIWYWDGSYEEIDTTAHAGTEADPYIIENAKQLNYIATRADLAETTGNHYKIADGVAAIIMQASGAEEIMALNSAAETKAYFESITPTNWMKNFGWKTFNGSFDGNNVPIYGLYVTHDSTHIGLFPQVDGGGDGTGASGAVVTDYVGVTYKNIIIRNSYYISTAGKRVGGIVAHTYGGSGAAYTNGTLNFDKIEFSNSYMSTTGTGADQAGILGANFDGEIIKSNNILIYGNQTQTGNNVVFPVFGAAEGSRTLNNDGTTWIHNTVENAIVLGATPYNLYKFGNRQSTVNSFENVYTDAASGTITFNTTNGSGAFYTMTYTDSDIKHVEPAELVGSAAAAVVTALNAANSDKTVWYEGNAWGYPSFEPAGTMPSAIQSVYDSLSLTNYDEYGETDPEFSMYATSLNLKTNPYIAFTFAFNGDYKANRDNITVTFETESKTITTTVGDGNGGVSAGWTNNAGAGRYHLYRLEDISVEDMCKDITVTVTYNGTEYNFGTFSVEGFALDLMNVNKKAPCDYYATRAEAAKALLFYTQMVNECYGGQR